MIVLILLVLGLCLGSFINALVWRLHEGKSVVYGRSMCTACGHRLGALELIPIFSWLGLGGRCRWCQMPISIQYPLVELLAATSFVASYIFWPTDLSQTGNLVLFISWLASSVGLLALAVYDLRWMILPNHIIYPTFFAALAGRLAYISFFAANKGHSLEQWALSLIVASGLFYILHEISRGQWIGFGDVRLGLITGTLLADPAKSLLMIFIASLLGTIFSLPKLLKPTKILNHRLAYGPYLILACAIALLFGQKLFDWYSNLL